MQLFLQTSRKQIEKYFKLGGTNWLITIIEFYPMLFYKSKFIKIENLIAISDLKFQNQNLTQFKPISAHIN